MRQPDVVMRQSGEMARVRDCARFGTWGELRQAMKRMGATDDTRIVLSVYGHTHEGSIAVEDHSPTLDRRTLWLSA